MGKLIAIIKREYLERVRTKWFVIATLLGPVMFLLLTALPVFLTAGSKATAESSNITIIDATGASLGPRVVAALADSTSVRPTVVAVDPSESAAAESTASRAVLSRQREGYLVLDSRTMLGTKARYAGRNSTTFRDMNRLGRALDKAVLGQRLEHAGIDISTIDSIMRVDVSLDKTQLSEQGREQAGAGNRVLGLIVAFLLYTVLIIYGQTVLRSVIEEKATRVAEVVISSVRPEILLAGKIIGIGGVAITQFAVWILGSFWIGSNVVPMIIKSKALGMSAAAADSVTRSNEVLTSLPTLSIGLVLIPVVFFVLGFVFYSCLYAAVGSTVNSESEAQQAATPVVMLLVLSAVFIQPVAFAPQSTAAIVMSLLPISAPIVMPMRMSLAAVPAWQLAVSIIGMVLACLAAIWFSARIYRVGLLMYGKRPTLRELFKWLRYS